ncbi:MAG TPA: cysteine-rich CWC family protein [Burkholderiaceae bacterium]|nr:cysteine-rich CWC family protein [Burkholderiaceae bacterium]
MNGSAAQDDLCPRCRGRFHCGVHDAAPCPCTTVRLDAATLAALRAQYDGCLCLRCLAELAASATARSAPQRM